jgi:hypothetical protein
MATVAFTLAVGVTDIAKVVAVLVGGAVVVDTVISGWVSDRARRLRKLHVVPPGPDREDEDR